MNEDENLYSIQVTDSHEQTTQNDNSTIETPEDINTESNDKNETNSNDNLTSSYTQNPILFYLKRLFTVAIKTVKTPYFMLSAFIKAADYKVALGFIIIQSFLFAGLLASIFDSLNYLINNFTPTFSSSLYGFNTFSIGKIFFATFISSIILLLIFAIILRILVTTILKIKVSYKQMLCISSSKCIAQIPFSLVAFFVCIFNPIVAPFIAALGTLLGYFFVASALKGLDNANENKIPYVAFLSFAILSIITILTVKIISPLFLSSFLSLGNGLY